MGVCMSFPRGAYEFASSRSSNVNGFFGVGFGIEFEESERMEAAFDADGGVVVNFRGEYDTGFQIIELRGDLQCRSADGTGNAFMSSLRRTNGNWHRREDETEECKVTATFTNDGLTVTLTPEPKTVVMPFKGRTWSLQKVA